MRNLLLRSGLLSLMLSLLLSCGGGGSGTDAAGGGAFVGPSGSGLAIGPDGQPLVQGTLAPDGAGTGIGGIASDDGGPTGSGGAGGSGNSGDSSTTASNGNDGSGGVGSGGTGVSTADATGVGSVDGAGSIIVNGLRYDTTNAVGRVEDAPNGLQLGMSAKVTGPVNADFTRGIARTLESAADVRGAVASVNAAQGSFVILGSTVTTDEATVWGDVGGMAAAQPGSTLQVWGLPGAPGVLRATRIEQRPPSPPILTGSVQSLDAARRTFVLGSIVVDYSRAAPGGSVDGRPLANGTLVRVRADTFSPGATLVATQVQGWYPVPAANDTTVQIAGIVTDFAGLGAFRVLGIAVDASAAQVPGGQLGAIGNGAKVDVAGVVVDGVLRVSKLRIRNVPGTGGPASFDVTGSIGSFRSASDFRVRGQPVNASGAGVVFANGNASSLRNGARVRVQGSRVVDGVLAADSVTFQ